MNMKDLVKQYLVKSANVPMPAEPEEELAHRQLAEQQALSEATDEDEPTVEEKFAMALELLIDVAAHMELGDQAQQMMQQQFGMPGGMDPSMMQQPQGGMDPSMMQQPQGGMDPSMMQQEEAPPQQGKRPPKQSGKDKKDQQKKEQ